MESASTLAYARQFYHPRFPSLLQGSVTHLSAQPLPPLSLPIERKIQLEEAFPHTFFQKPVQFVEEDSLQCQPRLLRVGLFFSGGPAAGGHNVITGLLDGLRVFHTESILYGFEGGPSGLLAEKYLLLNEEGVEPYRNQGGFDLLGSGRTKIESKEQLESAYEVSCKLKLDGLVVVGGDDSNTNAALMAEFFAHKGSKTSIVGVPKTIDGDLQNALIPISFGFDTACKVYSELIGNIARDALSARKYTHFVRVMGRSASHIALECALQTHPNLTLIGEEIYQRGESLETVVERIASLILKRAERGKMYGLILIPEGILEFIPEIRTLICELNRLLTESSLDREEKGWDALFDSLSAASRSCFSSLPREVARQLLSERDPHGNVSLARIDTEKLLIGKVEERLQEIGKSTSYKVTFQPQGHYLGYEGRAALPSNFDANYCYTLGKTALALIVHGYNGYLSSVGKLHLPPEEWEVGACPLSHLLDWEERRGRQKAVIAKKLVDLEGEPFRTFAMQRKQWEEEDHYLHPGPMQFFGDHSLTDTPPLSLSLRHACSLRN